MGRFRVPIELGKSGGVVLKVLFKGLYAGSIGRMVRKKLRNLPHVSVLKILEQPRQTPGVVTGLRANIGASHIGV